MHMHGMCMPVHVVSRHMLCNASAIGNNYDNCFALQDNIITSLPCCHLMCNTTTRYNGCCFFSCKLYSQYILLT